MILQAIIMRALASRKNAQESRLNAGLIEEAAGQILPRLDRMPY